MALLALKTIPPPAYIPPRASPEAGRPTIQRRRPRHREPFERTRKLVWFSQKAVVRPNWVSVVPRNFAARINALRNCAITEGGATSARNVKCDDVSVKRTHDTVSKIIWAKIVSCNF